jgi:23S rRNA pseudouridine1911/1915/1917 synthase
MDLAVLYEDEAVVAVNKPPGIVVHPTYRNWTGTLLNGLLARYAEPRIMTRLDRDTSGLVIVALGAEMHARLQRDSIAGRMKKEYLAVVRGTPDPAVGTIDAPLARSAADRRVVVVDPEGQESRTTYRVIADGSECSLVCCELETGRTHQIRVHLASLGHPILGDGAYGTSDSAMTRQALHAWRVTLPHPVSRADVHVEAPLPEDFAALLARQNLTL